MSAWKIFTSYFDPITFFAWVYSLIGAVGAGLWWHVSKKALCSRFERVIGFALYLFVWPVMVSLDVWEAIKVERKFRGAMKRKGNLQI